MADTPAVANWVENRLVVSGDRMDVAAFREAVRGRNDDGVELVLDFESVRPTPLELANGCRARDTAAVGELLGEFRRLKALGTEEERVVFLRDWAHALSLVDPELRLTWGLPEDESPEESLTIWRTCAWGVKWNLDAENLNVADADEGRAITFLFVTPWNAPLGIADTLAARFPELSFELTYAETAAAYAGYRRYEAGALIVSEDEGPHGDPVALLRRAGWAEPADELAEWLAEVAAGPAEESA